jgi:N,N-dimethylformamidase
METSPSSADSNRNLGPVLLAYADRVSVAPSESLRFMVSSESPNYLVQVVRLIHGDENEAGPGHKEELVPSAVNGLHPGQVQPIQCGSFIRVPEIPVLPGSEGISLQAWILPTTPRKGLQGLLTRWCRAQKVGYGLFIDENGILAFGLANAGGAAGWVRADGSLEAWVWYFVAATYDASTGELCLYRKARGAARLSGWDWSVTQTSHSGRVLHASVPFCMGALVEHAEPRELTSGHFNGKIDSPALFSRALTRGEIESLEQGVPPAKLGDALVAAWDFSQEISTKRIIDRSGHGYHGTAINMPARAVTGHNWDGDMFSSFLETPETYGAIHFHDDDLEDAGWDVDFELPIGDLKSGIYAVRLTAGPTEYYAPFVVRPKPNQPTSRIVFLAPSLTWQAYANFNEIANPYNLTSAEPLPWLREDLFIAAHPELGLSLYDHHTDGSSPFYSTRLRPNVSGGPKHKYAPVASPHLLAADLYVVDWLTEKSYDFDVISDEDLHFGGRDVLLPYKVLITGAHPEYWTGQMIDALDGYLNAGGRVMYLGGNGIYWITSLHSECPVIEVRRSLGTGLSRASDGEYYHSTTGERGGIWRARGRSPQKLLGVGFCAQGGAPGSPYRRRPSSCDPRAAFIFEGIGDDEIIGGFGLNTGAAAGFEIDRLDYVLGSPPHTLLLASSSGHHESYWHVVEEVSIIGPHECGSASKDVRADMTLYEHQGGGAVFSVGSIAWTGSLSYHNYTNNVSRITENVLRRFLLETPFVQF